MADPNYEVINIQSEYIEQKYISMLQRLLAFDRNLNLILNYWITEPLRIKDVKKFDIFKRQRRIKINLFYPIDTIIYNKSISFLVYKVYIAFIGVIKHYNQIVYNNNLRLLNKRRYDSVTRPAVLLDTAANIDKIKVFVENIAYPISVYISDLQSNDLKNIRKLKKYIGYTKKANFLLRSVDTFLYSGHSYTHYDKVINIFDDIIIEENKTNLVYSQKCACCYNITCCNKDVLKCLT